MAHGKHRFKFDPVDVTQPQPGKRRGWDPNQMNEAEAAEMRAAADRVIATWKVLETELLNLLQLQRRCQGGWPTFIRMAATQIHLNVSTFLSWTGLEPKPQIPPFPNAVDAEPSKE